MLHNRKQYQNQRRSLSTMNNKIYIFLFIFLFFNLVFERQCVTIFMFPHIANDFRNIGAQGSFAIAQFMYWFSSFLIDPIFGVIVDRINTPYYVFLIICVSKVMCGLVYSLTTNITVVMVTLCLSGALKNLQPIIYHEINRLTEKGNKENVLNLVHTSGIFGRLTSTLFRLLPDGEIYHLFHGVYITSSTLPSLINSVTYLIGVPFIICAYITKAEVFNDKEMETKCEQKSIHVRTNWIKIIVILFNSLMAGLTWETITITVVEYGKDFNLSSLVLTTLFLVQCVCAIVTGIMFRKTLKYCGNKKFMLLINVSRIAAVIFCYFATLSQDIVISCTLLLFACLLSSLAYFFDFTLLLPELWKLHEQIALLSAIFVLAMKFGYMMGFLLPMCFNFIALIISLNLFLLALVISLNYYTDLI